MIDTKFTGLLKPGMLDQDRFKSGYDYQMYAYLRSQEQPARSSRASLVRFCAITPVLQGIKDRADRILQDIENRKMTCLAAMDALDALSHEKAEIKKWPCPRLVDTGLCGFSEDRVLV